MPAPFFSVVLPTYNRAHLLSRAVESVFAQTDGDWELIVVDDGSTDNTAALLNDLESRDVRVHGVNRPHSGLALSRNAGIAASSGNYVTFLDSDDAYAPDHLRVRHDYLLQHPEIELLHGGVTVIGDEYVADKFNPSKKIHLRDCVIGGTFVVARDLLARLGGWAIADYGDDNAFFSKAVAAGARIATIDAPTYRYYRGEADSLCTIAELEGMEGVRKFQGRSSL